MRGLRAGRMKTQHTCHGTRGQDAAAVPERAEWGAYTLVEIMIAVSLFGLVMAGAIEIYMMCNKLWHATELKMEVTRASSLAVTRIVYGLETNHGLRAASAFTFNTNVHGHWDGAPYWETGAAPLPPSSAMQYLCGSGGLGDGSWRLGYSNNFCGMKYIDYNRQERSLLFLPQSNSIADRMLICNYVKAARITTNLSGTIGIELEVEKRAGNFLASNVVSTLVKIRN